jgi:hypothetical protein
MLIEAHANLLEFTLASYEALCGLKKQPKMELQRHETAIKEAFERAHKLLKEGLGPKPPFGQSYNRVRTLASLLRAWGLSGGRGGSPHAGDPLRQPRSSPGVIGSRDA